MVRYADETDFGLLKTYDKQICEAELKNSIHAKRVLVLFHNGMFIGWLRFNLFWDHIPFLNMLYLLVQHCINN